MSTIAVIGTAGRSHKDRMVRSLWDWMLTDARSRIPSGAHLVSGGAAWADHLAVALFLEGHAGELTLHLPAPLAGQFQGPNQSAASAANYYHQLFTKAIGEDSLAQIVLAASKDGCHGSIQPSSTGYGAMFARNKLVAQADSMLAYTFNQGTTPADGGTAHTWALCTGPKTHISLPL